MTTFHYLILGILKDRSLSGYDLDKFYGYVVRYFWSSSRMKVYRALHRLADLGWVEVEEIEQAGSPNKKLYHLTATGREQLDAWLREPPADDPTHAAWLGQMFFADELTADEFEGLLAARTARVEDNLAVLEARLKGASLEEGMAFQKRQLQEQGMAQRLPTGVITLHYGVELLRFQRAWLQRVATAVGAADLPADRDGADEQVDDPSQSFDR